MHYKLVGFIWDKQNDELWNKNEVACVQGEHILEGKKFFKLRTMEQAEKYCDCKLEQLVL